MNTRIKRATPADNRAASHQIPLFELFNSFAHKRKTINVGHPAIIWHQAYWKPDDMAENDWHRHIDQYLKETGALFAELVAGEEYESEIGGGILDIAKKKMPLDAEQLRDFYGSRYKADLSASYFRLRKGGLKLSIVVEKFDEFWSCKTIIDFSTVARPTLLADWLKPLRAALIEAESLLVSRFNLVNKVHPIENAQARATLEAKTAEISYAISKALFDSRQLLLPQVSTSEASRKISPPDQIFANFVGMSFGIDIEPPGRERYQKAARFGSNEALNVIDNILPERNFDRHDVPHTSALVEAAWPLVKGINPYFQYEQGNMIAPPDKVVIRDKDEKREFTISLLNRGRSLYVTSLGGVRYQTGPGAAFPLSYLIISPHRATWQIGRIVDRVHSLGLFRLAALKDYDLIEQANDRLSELGNSINIGRKITDISKDFANLLRWSKNGLVDRIEWSRYYLKLFNETVGRLSFERVEGYQTYEEFISRRLSGRFLTIDDVWNRVEGLSRQIRSRTAEETGASIKDLLGFAEIVSIVPVPYYLHHVMDYANPILLQFLAPIHLNLSLETAWFGASALYIAYVFLWRQELYKKIWAHFRPKRN